MPEYIEREALLKDIGETVLFTVRENAKLPTAEMRGANKVIDRIKSTPTADVQEVKHGEWEWFAHNSKTFTCSNCHITQTVNVYNDKIMFNYCPYCGARMDKE